MARGYSTPEIRRRLIESLGDSETGVSGAELAKMTGISRITLTKYLKILAMEGVVREREMGNLTLWSLEPGQESFAFPDDYFVVATAYLKRLVEGSEGDVSMLVRNCVLSGASKTRLILEAILPASDHIFELYDGGKIGTAEQRLLHNTISRSLRTLERIETAQDPKRNVVVMAADAQSTPAAEAASAAYRVGGWSVFELGDMSHAAGILFDLDFQRLIDRIWRQKQGILLVVVFSHAQEGLNFFADAINPVRKKNKRRMRLILCGRGTAEAGGGAAAAAADLSVSDVKDVLQWSQTVSGSV